jgi:hypothetical protein
VDCALKPNLSPEEDDTLRSLFNLMVNRLRFGSFRIASRLIVHLNSQPDLPRPILFDLEIRGSPFKTGPVVNDWRAGSPRRPFFDPSDFRCQAKLRGNRDSLIEAFPLRLG